MSLNLSLVSITNNSAPSTVSYFQNLQADQLTWVSTFLTSADNVRWCSVNRDLAGLKNSIELQARQQAREELDAFNQLIHLSSSDKNPIKKEAKNFKDWDPVYENVNLLVDSMTLKNSSSVKDRIKLFALRWFRIFSQKEAESSDFLHKYLCKRDDVEEGEIPPENRAFCVSALKLVDQILIYRDRLFCNPLGTNFIVNDSLNSESRAHRRSRLLKIFNNEGRLSEAIVVIEEIPIQNPDDKNEITVHSDALNELGRALMAQKRFKDAHSLEKYAPNRESKGWYQYNLALGYMELGLLLEAATTALKNEYPQAKFPALVAISRMLLDQNKVLDAVKIADLIPDYDDPMAALWSIFTKLKEESRFDELIEMTNHVTPAPNKLPFFAWIESELIDRKRYADAKKVLDKTPDNYVRAYWSSEKIRLLALIPQ